MNNENDFWVTFLISWGPILLLVAGWIYFFKSVNFKKSISLLGRFKKETEELQVINKRLSDMVSNYEMKSNTKIKADE